MKSEEKKTPLWFKITVICIVIALVVVYILSF